MKNLVLFFVIIIVMFSCKKSDLVSVPIDSEAIRAELVKVSTPSKEAVQTMLTTQKLKSGELQSTTLVQIFPLESRTFEVYDNYAVKNFVYYEIDQNGYREKLLSIRQQFQIVNGVMDTTSSVMSYEVGCQYSRYFNLNNQWSISNITYFFHFDDGRQFAYFGENNNNIKLPPIAGGKWQLNVVYDDGDMRQEFVTDLVNFYAESNMLTLRLGVKKENTVSYLQLSKDFIKGSYLIQLEGENDEGDFIYRTYPIIFDQSMPAILTFDSPFEIKRFIICGNNGCWWYDVKVNSFSSVNGKPIYGVK